MVVDEVEDVMATWKLIGGRAAVDWTRKWTIVLIRECGSLRTIMKKILEALRVPAMNKGVAVRQADT